MDKLIIVGAGDLGREVLQWALQSDDQNKFWSVAGFLDDNHESLEGKDVGYPILGRIRDWRPKTDEKYIVTIRTPKQLEKIVGYLADNNAQFVNVIHRSVIIASTVNLGQGVILCPNVVVSDHANIDSHTVVNIGSCIGHDVKIGEFSTISSLCDITGDVTLGKNVFLGSKVSIVPRCKIGDSAFLCAGSVVMNNVKAMTRVMGIPAKKFEVRKG